MKKFQRILMFGVLAWTLTVQTGCFGTFQLTRQIYTWNGSVEDKTVRSLLFFALCVIPVYPIAAFIDWAILNVVEFWDGSNPVSLKPGEVERQDLVYRGKQMRMEARQNTLSVFAMEKGAYQLKAEFVFKPENHSWNLRKDGQLTMLSRLVKDANGDVAVVVMDKYGKEHLAEYPGEKVAWETYIQQGEAPFMAVR
jgi:Domain of unknown function (DUF3332)